MTFGTIGNLKISCCSIAELLDAVRLRATSKDRPFRINCLNAHLFNLCLEDHALMQHINDSDVVAADGISMVWGARFLGIPVKSRCNMTEAFRAYLAADGMPFVNAILIGCSDVIARLCADTINGASRHCFVTQAYSGYLSDSAYESILMQHRDVDFVLIGMGSPKSERISCLASRICSHAVIWHIGGGTMNFMAGVMSEAPVWMRRSGLQWLHRFLKEPRRMWRRYLIGNPRFLWHLWRARKMNG